MKTKMSIEWKTGRPERNGDYIVIFERGYVLQTTFTTEYGWNTTGDLNNEFAMPDKDIVAWCENFGKHVIDIYGHRDIMEEKEG